MSGVKALGTLQQHDVSDIRIFYPSSLPNEQLGDDTERLPASAVISAREKESTAFMALRSFLSSAVLAEDIEEARVLLEDSDLLEKCPPQIRVATRAGHVLSASSAFFRGDGSVSSLEQACRVRSGFGRGPPTVW